MASTNVLALKQGYLKKLPNQMKLGSSLKRADRRWTIFGLTREQKPYLAFYQNEDTVLTSAPLRVVPLRTCCHITKSLNLKGHTNVFTLRLDDRQLSLMAPTMGEMDEWCRIIDTTLKSLGILQPDGNLYSVQPSPTLPSHNHLVSSPQSTVPSQSNSQRDPTSPLPPAPAFGLLVDAPPPPLVRPPVPLPPAVTAAPLAELQLSEPTLLDLSHLENAMNEHQGNAAVEASGEVYEPLWEPQSGPPAGNNTGPTASGAAASPDGVAPPIPRRSTSRSQPTPSTTGAAPSPVHPAGRGQQQQQQQTQREPAQYGCIWSGGSAGAAGQRRRTCAGPEVTTPATTTTTTSLQPPRYTEHDETSPQLQPARPTSLASVDVRGLPPWTPPTGSASNPSATRSPVSSSQARMAGPHASSSVPPYTVGASMGATVSPLSAASPQGTTASPAEGGAPSKMMEALGLQGDGGGGSDGVYGWNAPPLDDHDAPPPYMPRAAARGPVKSLKETQVEALEKEMNHAGGVKVILRKLDCHLTIAWVECCSGVWIAGWNQKSRPFLHNAFHVGDQVVSINGQVVESARMAHKLIKHSGDSARITFILRRVPHARVFALKRAEDGENLGLRREGGTGEILEVEPYGVAGRHGVPARAPSLDRRGLCNWFITEINMRPVSLFFKEDEIEKRLNAVGKDISILIQPTEFINEMKAQLKKNFKNYKDFIVQ